MPVRKSSTPARKSTSSRSRSASSRSKKQAAPASGRSTPTPDPEEVQRIIARATANAEARYAAGGAPVSPAAPAAAPAEARPFERHFRNGVLEFLFGSRSITYTPRATAQLTDLIGTFLISCIAIYFTVAGYLFYREIALSAA